MCGLPHMSRASQTYVHRSGRTGRGGVHGGEGLSLSLVAPGENTRFRRLRRAMAPGVADEAALTLPEYPIELGMLPMCRKRLVLASKLDSAKSKRKRGRAADAFTARHTEEMDLVGPEAAGGSSSDVAGDVTPDEERMEAELTRMLALPVGGGASASAAAVAAALGSGATQPRKRAALADELRERRASGGKALSKKARRRLEAERAALANERQQEHAVHELVGVLARELVEALRRAGRGFQSELLECKHVVDVLRARRRDDDGERVRRHHDDEDNATPPVPRMGEELLRG